MIDENIGFRTHKTGVEPFELLYKSEKKIYNTHKKLYTEALSPNSNFLIVKDDRLGGARVIAKKAIPKKIKITQLAGQHYPISQNFIKPGVNDFLIFTSQLNKKNKIFLGPCSFVNHDCEPNTMFISRNKTETCVETIRKIDKGEEITAYYSPFYFGLNNNECKCRTCENKNLGFFTPKSKVLY